MCRDVKADESSSAEMSTFKARVENPSKLSEKVPTGPGADGVDTSTSLTLDRLYKTGDGDFPSVIAFAPRISHSTLYLTTSAPPSFDVAGNSTRREFSPSERTLTYAGGAANVRGIAEIGYGSAARAQNPKLLWEKTRT